MAKSTASTETDFSSKASCIKVDMYGLGLVLDFVFDSKLPIVIWGVKAVGKTTKVEEVAREKGYRLEVLHLATQDIVDLIGMMSKVPEDKDGEKLSNMFEAAKLGKDFTPDEIEWIKNTMYNGKMKTVWTRPQWLHNDDDIPTVYFLDEMNRGNKFVAAAMLPFLLEGRIHQHRMGKNDLVVAACNPSTGKYSVNDSFSHDEALKDRVGHVILQPTNDEFFNYAQTKLDDTTLKVLKSHDHFINIEDFNLPFKVEPSRRSLVNVMSKVGKKDKRWLRSHGKPVIGCYLGTQFLESWWNAKFANDRHLDISDLLNIDENMPKIREAICAVVDGKDVIKLDIYEASLDTIVTWFAREYKDGHSKIDWLIKYFKIPIIPKDTIAATFSKINMLSYPNLIEKIMESGIITEIPGLDEYYKLTNLTKKVK